MNNRSAESAGTRRCGALACAIVALICVETSRGETVPTTGAVDSRVRVVAYNSEEVYKIRGFVGYQIDLEFEAGETFTGLGAGDIDGLSFVGQDNHLFLKPKAAKVTTNLTVLTSRRHYQFDYSAASRRAGSADQGVIYALRFTYSPPIAESAAQAMAKRLNSRLESASAERPKNLDYWYCGQPALRPTAAFDDGVHTRLRFPATAELPAIFVHNEDGSESLLNFSIEAGDVVVHRVARQFILRRGKLTGCVVNRGFVGGGARLDSGTVSSDVERRVQGISP